MISEYQRSLNNWVQGLTDNELARYMLELEAFTDAEIDALIKEDIRRILIVTI